MFSRPTEHRRVALVANRAVRRLPSPRLLRYAGLGATCVITLGAYSAGALTAGDPAPTLRVSGLASTTPRFQIGLALVVAGSAGLIAVWWRLSDHLRAATPVRARWLAMTGLLWALPLVLAPPLASRDMYSYACQGWLYGADRSPYRISPLAGHCPWTDAVAPTWLDSTAPYGPAGIAVTAAAALPSHLASPTADIQLIIFVTVLRVLIVVAILLAAAAAARVAQRCGVPPVRAVAVGLVTPLVAVHGVSGAHLDVIVLALVIGGLWAATTRLSRSRAAVVVGPAAAGVLIGLAVAVKVSATVALPFAAILAAQAASGDRAAPRRRALIAVMLALGGAGAALAVTTAILGLDYGWITALSGTTNLVQWTSPPTAVGMSAGYLLRMAGHPELFDPAVLLARLAGLLIFVTVFLALLIRAWQQRTTTRTVVACCGWALVASVALAPVFYPWYALTPLAVLALTVPNRRGVHRIMAATTVLMLLVIPNGLGVATLTKAPGAFAVAAVVATAIAIPRARAIGVRHSRINRLFHRGALDLPSRPQRRPGRFARASMRKAVTSIGIATNHASKRG